MRRPVKPFVTEYRGSSRRGKETPSSAASAFADLPNIDRPRAERARGAPKEDSYEAAMRAADALFAPQPSKPTIAAEPEAFSATDIDKVFSTPSSLPEADLGTADPGRTDAANGAGRILQAIEEPVADQLAELEIERTPKPRGRRPGSKNKPKSGMADTGIAVAAAVPCVAEQAEVAQNDAPKTAPVRPAMVAPMVVARPNLASRKRGERFGWVRTRLRPGEKWKRRLPKIAW